LNKLRPICTGLLRKHCMWPWRHCCWPTGRAWPDQWEPSMV